MRFSHITVEHDKMGGLPCIRGFRIPVATIHVRDIGLAASSDIIILNKAFSDKRVIFARLIKTFIYFIKTI